MKLDEADRKRVYDAENRPQHAPSAAITPLIGGSLMAKIAMRRQVRLRSDAPSPRFESPW